MSEKAWDDEGVEEVLDGVFRIPLPLPNDGLRAVNVYAISDGDGLVVIDSGWALQVAMEQFERSLAEIDHKLADIRQFLVTHMHRDHYTGAIAIRRLLGTQVRVGAGEETSIANLTNRDGRDDSGFGFGHQLDRFGAHDLLVRTRAHPHGDGEDGNVYEMPDGWLLPGWVDLTHRRLEVVETPGHTRGHVVFHDLDAGALFAGDHVLPRITPSIGLEVGAASLPLANYLDSLRLVRARPDARLLPAHGPVTDSVHERVDELLAHHEQRLTNTATAVEQGASSAFDVAQILRWTRRERAFDDLDIYNQVLAVGETYVHLEVCVVRGWLRSAEDAEGVLRFSRA